jgi:hypothetical protein
METFGYNLKDNLISILRNNIMNNLHFGFGTRSNTEWGTGVLLYVKDYISVNTTIEIEKLTLIESIGIEYFMTFFDEDFSKNQIFKVIKPG